MALRPESSAGKKPTLLIDEPVLGLDEFLRDLGWNTAKVRQGDKDDGVLMLAKANDYVVITPDRKLVNRCRLQGVRVVNVGFEDLAKRVHWILVGDTGLRS